MRRTTATILLAALATLTACTSSGSDDKAAPDYKVTKQDTTGNQREIDVEVTSATGLRAVFDDVTAGLKDDAGYMIYINCSTGGTSGADNRLANGKYAVGRMGAATTGLDAGSKEFEPVAGRKCPDKS